MPDRGLVIIPEFSVNLAENRLEIRNLGGPFMIEAVRRNLPYWDKFDLPDNPLIGSALPLDLEYLQSSGIVRKSDVRIPFSGPMAELWVLSQYEAWRLNEEREPGIWSLGQSGTDFWLPESARIESRMLELELYSILPVPGPDTSFNDILEFKGRRTAELQAFRVAMDDLYSSIITAGDIPRSRVATISRLERALEDLHKATAESWSQRLLSSIKVEVSFPQIAGGAAIGAKIASKFSLPMEWGAAIGAAAAALKFDIKQTAIAVKSPAERSDFAYVYRVEQELDS